MKEPAVSPWRLFIDTGGTFTDCLAQTPDGSLGRAKVLSSSRLRGRVEEVPAPDRLLLQGPWPSSDGLLEGLSFSVLDGLPDGQAREEGKDGDGEGPPTIVASKASGEVQLSAPPPRPITAGTSCELRSPEEAPLLAARLVLGLSLKDPFPPVALRLATTRGTNALLERSGARTVLFVTEGFRDLLAIGTQQRPDLFALEIRRPPPLAETVVEVPERLAADGSVLRPLKVEALGPAVRKLLEEGFESAAVALMHSFRRSCHEEHLEALLRDAGFGDVSCSAALAPRIGYVGRAQTAVVDAYLGPVIRRYLERVEEVLPQGSRLQVMTSAGGLVGSAEFRPKDSLLSGPAGGVVGAVEAGRREGYGEVIAFDMGGTSTDVSRSSGGAYDYRHEQEVAGVELVAPTLAIETVAAGGGSVCWYDGHRLRVGPKSAGAFPGPASYGAGGPLTITDVNLLLGRLDPQGFEIPIDEAAAQAAAEALARQVAAREEVKGLEELLAGLLTIADERMADAIRTISIRRGHDPRQAVLVAFGGAGPQHACAVAELLGMGRALVPGDAALLSARGLRSAALERFAVRQVLQTVAEVKASLPVLLQDLEGRAVEAVMAEGLGRDEVAVRHRTFHLRYLGQESTLALEDPPIDGLEDAFGEAYERRLGYRPEGRPVELESLVVVAASKPASDPGGEGPQRGDPVDSEASRGAAEGPRKRGVMEGSVDGGGKAPRTESRAYFDGRWQAVTAVRREDLRAGEEVAGPGLVFERHSATVVGPGWTCIRAASGALRLERQGTP